MNVTVEELISEIGRLHIQVMALQTQLNAAQASNAAKVEAEAKTPAPPKE